MKNFFRIKKNYKIVIFVIISIILTFLYSNIIVKKVQRYQFAKGNMEIYKKNEEHIFNIEKIIICSSANAIDLSGDKSLQKLNIYQYTDIAVYIKNPEELTNKSTIKQLYIDNINLESPRNVGIKSLNYRNILDFGAKRDVTNIENQSIDRIDFKIINTNQENENADYDEPTFYTDCSNPITLQYLNNNIVTNYQMEKNTSVAFDGSILHDAGITPEMIQCKVKFKINIINNEGEKYNCWINFDIPLDDIFEGTTMKAKTTNGNKYVFFRE